MKKLILGTALLSLMGCDKLAINKEKELFNNPSLPPKIQVEEAALNISSFDSKKIGEKIWKNEHKPGDKSGLVQWNDGEDFLSVGNGHFTWHNELTQSNINNSFPELINYIKTNHPEQYIPLFLTMEKSPWINRDNFIKSKKTNHDDLIIQMEKFFLGNFEVQCDFFIYNLEKTLTTIIEQSNKPDLMKGKLKALTNTEQGVYALADYVNFKGSGLNTNERYNGQGWGLLQVLEDMQGTSLESFVDSARDTLILRAVNNPSDEKWLKGWQNRLNTYLEN